MARPLLTLTAIAPLPGLGTATPFDLTAATGGINGFTRADFNITGPGATFQRTKLNGALQLVENPFGVVSSTSSNYWGTGGFTAVYQDNDVGQAATAGSDYQSNGYNFAQATLSCGVFYTLMADQKLCQGYWYGTTSAGMQVTLTLSDNSVAPITLALPNGDSSFSFQFTAIALNSTLDVRIQKVGTAAVGFIGPMVRYLKPAVKAPKPAGLSRALRGSY